MIYKYNTIIYNINLKTTNNINKENNKYKYESCYKHTKGR